MVRQSSRTVIFKCFLQLWRNLLLNAESTDAFRNRFHFGLLITANLCRLRYLAPRIALPKSKVWFHHVLNEYANLEHPLFETHMRVTPEQFVNILKLIQGEPIFQSTTGRPQTPVPTQLAITLYRFGHECVTTKTIAELFGVSNGGLINDLTQRVSKALLAHCPDIIKWPSLEEQLELSAQMDVLENGLPKCVAFLDGTHIPLAEAPENDPESYFNRKSRYSLQVQIICDRHRVIRHVVVGYPGSVHDSRVFNDCTIGKNPEKFLTNGHWIAADSAYRLTQYVMTPFRSNATIGSEQERKFFNTYFSHHRVVVEHVNGILKEKFSSLKQLSLRIDGDRSYKFAVNWIMTCLCLYNLLRLYGRITFISIPNIKSFSK